MTETIAGMKELQNLIDRLGKLPQKCVTQAVRKGASVLRVDTKSRAPVDTGALKRGLKLVGERSALKGKKVYQVVFDRDMNDIFVKESKSGKRAYYPASQEYGFFARNGRYIPGYHFMKQTADDDTAKVKEIVLSELGKNIDKELSR